MEDNAAQDHKSITANFVWLVGIAGLIAVGVWYYIKQRQSINKSTAAARAAKEEKRRNKPAPELNVEPNADPG